MTETASSAPGAYDLILRNGTVIDGSGADRIAADVAIAGERIAAVGAPGSLRPPAGQEIDVTGRIGLLGLGLTAWYVAAAAQLLAGDASARGHGEHDRSASKDCERASPSGEGAREPEAARAA